MRTKSLLASVSIVATIGAAITGGATGASATPTVAFLGYAAGSLVRAVDSTVTSDLSAESLIFGGPGTSDHNDLASLRVSNLIQAGAVTTKADAHNIAGGSELVTEVHVADVVLLGGAIRIEAVDTVSTVKTVN